MYAFKALLFIRYNLSPFRVFSVAESACTSIALWGIDSDQLAIRALDDNCWNRHFNIEGILPNISDRISTFDDKRVHCNVFLYISSWSILDTSNLQLAVKWRVGSMLSAAWHDQHLNLALRGLAADLSVT